MGGLGWWLVWSWTWSDSGPQGTQGERAGQPGGMESYRPLEESGLQGHFLISESLRIMGQTAFGPGPCKGTGGGWVTSDRQKSAACYRRTVEKIQESLGVKQMKLDGMRQMLMPNNSAGHVQRCLHMPGSNRSVGSVHWAAKPDSSRDPLTMWRSLP